MSSVPLRICHLVSDDAWGGAEAVVAELLQGQRRQSEIELHLVALNDGRLAEVARNEGVPVRITPESGRSFLALLKDLRDALGVLRPDVVHSHRYKENVLSYWLGPRLGFRCVATFHGYEPNIRWDMRLRDWLRRRVARTLASRARAQFAAVSKDLRDVLRVDEKRCAIISNGVTVPSNAVETARQRDLKVVGWMGRMVPIKDLQLLLEAFSRLPDELNDARLLLVGDGPERPAIQERVRELGIGDRVEMTGFCDNPDAQYRRMSLLALTSRHEGLPMVLLEAMALGLPCVSAAVGGIPSAVGTTSVLLIEERDPEVWARALSEVLIQPERARRLGEEGRSLVINEFSAQRCAAAYLELYRSVLW